uniref:Uncharacterized protein n=1 Tax=Leersia perrieri TaxID=77586 RepID=A0A0D9XZT0_9ORYZ
MTRLWMRVLATDHGTSTVYAPGIREFHSPGADSFFQRQGNGNREYYIQQVTAHCFAQTRQCYCGNVDDYTVEMLTCDGCFIVEILLRWEEGMAHHDNYVQLMSHSIYYDLLLVDNQIPFFVLARIFQIFKNHNNGNPNIRLVDLVINFFNHRDLPNPYEVRHLLDLQYKLVVGNNRGINIDQPTLNTCPTYCSNICYTPSMPRGIPGANELQDYGVRFNVNENQNIKMFDITFKGKTMKIPRFEINFGSKILLANLFAYDQIKGQSSGNRIARQPTNNIGDVTSYVVLMNALINTRHDVMVLQREGILDNLLSNEEEVATFFNKLGRCALVDVSEHRYTSMFNDVNRYWRNTFNLCKYLAIFRMKHFRNPWTCLSLVGAIMVLVFSCTSMVISILNYRQPGRNTFMRLPIYMREANRGLFEPRALSIGPYHRGKESTRDMEIHKERVIHGFFQRPGNGNLEYYIQQTRQCYCGNINDYTVEMLTCDWCFIIEILLRWKQQTANCDNYIKLMSHSIYYDLSSLFQIFKDHNNGNPNILLVDLVIDFFNHGVPFSWVRSNPSDQPNRPCRPNSHEVHHLLDLQYKLVADNNRGIVNTAVDVSDMPLGIPGANELQDYGVKFRMNKNKDAKLFDITFRGATMEIPRFEINFGSKILLANLFAYDQIKSQSRNRMVGEQGNNQQNIAQPAASDSFGDVTSYVVLMNALINTRDDVVVLQREGILDNLLSDEEEVASFFNDLGRCALVDVSRHRYTGMFNDVNRYWMNTLNIRKCLVIFQKKHLRNPWTCLSLVSAILILFISFTSIVITILNFRRNLHP